MSQLSKIDELWSEASPAHENGEHPPTNTVMDIKATSAPLLKNIPAKTIKQAWFIMAHLVLEKGAKALYIMNHDGSMIYTMAILNPDIEFIGIHSSEEVIKTAKKKYQFPNLSFIKHKIQENFMPLGSFDAIINSFNLHEIYSENNCNEKSVTDILERQFALLKKDGYIYTQGYNMYPEDDYVLMEMPDEKNKGDNIEDISEIDLLTLYSESARPRENDSYRGFYLEELPARFPRTKLFRLPAKWAYEFILRKDNRKAWQKDLYKEYSFFSRQDFSRIMRGFGARVLYSAPHWNEDILKNYYNKKMRLFKEDGTPMGSPETSFVLLAQKTEGLHSLTLQERRPSRTEDSALRITAMRNEHDGSIVDIVSRDLHITEILPYRVTPDNKLNIFVHEGIPRCLANTVQRKGPNIDGKLWSGHMTETFAIPREVIKDLDKEHFRSTLAFSKDYLGLTPEMGTLFEDGPGFFPAPDCIDEHVETLYLKVKEPKKLIAPKIILDDASGFSTNGRIREIDAQQILNAISVGLVPTSRLEIQILGLYEKLGIEYQAWATSPLTLQTETPKKATKLEEIIAKMAENDNRFKDIKGTTGHIKTMQSIFVDEGQDHGGIMGLASKDKDFIINEEGSMNTAVVLPLARSLNGEIMAGIVEQYLPIPQRYKGNGYSVSCPSFPLPVEIKNFDMARKYIADKFEVPVDCVARMGESYFSHIGVTPQRIYPFAVSKAGTSGWKKAGRAHGATSYAPLYDLYRLLYLDNYDSFIKIVAMSYNACLGQNSDMSASLSFSKKHAERKASFMGMSDASAPKPNSNKKDYTHD